MCPSGVLSPLDFCGSSADYAVCKLDIYDVVLPEEQQQLRKNLDVKPYDGVSLMKCSAREVCWQAIVFIGENYSVP